MLFGIPLAADDSDMGIINWAVKLVTSKDPVIHDMAWAEFKETADYRYQSTRVQNMQNFLNSVPGEKSSNKYMFAVDPCS